MAAKKTQKETGKHSIARAKAAELLWDEWKVRHGLFWQSFYRWGAATVTLEALPYLNPNLLTQLGKFIIVFPCLAALLALFGAWHLYAEYFRLSKTTEKYNEVMGIYAPKRFKSGQKKSFSEKLVSPRMGHVIPAAFLVAAIPVTALNVIILISLIPTAQ